MKVYSILAGVALAAASAMPVMANLDPTLQCHLGAYTLADGRTLAITGYAGTSHDLRYVLSSGEYGHLAWTANGTYQLRALKDEPYGSLSFAGCAPDGVSLRENASQPLTARRVALPVSETNFDSKGTRLFGKLVMPKNGRAEAILVWVEGSDDDPSTGRNLAVPHGV